MKWLGTMAWLCGSWLVFALGRIITVSPVHCVGLHEKVTFFNVTSLKLPHRDGGQLPCRIRAFHSVTSDLVFLDGHGVVHERGLGLASHVGVLLGVPTIGVPKTPFHAIDHLPGPQRGDFYVLTKEWGAQGASIRLKAGVKPVYVSPGHLVDLDSAIALALTWSSGRQRVPEPLAAAHTMSALARNASAGS